MLFKLSEKDKKLEDKLLCGSCLDKIDFLKLQKSFKMLQEKVSFVFLIPITAWIWCSWKNMNMLSRIYRLKVMWLYNFWCIKSKYFCLEIHFCLFLACFVVVTLFRVSEFTLINVWEKGLCIKPSKWLIKFSRLMILFWK